MGRKVHPLGFRLGIIKDWQSRWYADRNYADLAYEDALIRKAVSKRLSNASLSKIEIQRSANQIEVSLHTAKPGVVIGKQGASVDELRAALETMTGKKVKVNIEEVKQPELDAYLVAESIAEQLSRRVSYRRAVKQSVLRARRAGAKGVRVRVSGRLGGAEMARSVWEMEGRVPLHTIRADIDYGVVHAHTTYGRIGVKVWIYRGEVIERKGGDALLEMDRPAAMATPRPDRARPPRERGGREGGGRDDRPRGGRGDDRGGFRGERTGDRAPRGEGRAPRGEARSDERGGRARATGNPTPTPQNIADADSGSVPGGMGRGPEAGAQPQQSQADPGTDNNTGGTE
jgi:small subunit ribosomal protein S3